MDAVPWTDELLNDTLALFDNWDDHLSDVACNFDHSIVSNDGVSVPPRPVKINASRERQKREIQTLQHKVLALETTLKQLQQRTRAPRLVCDSSGTNDAVSNDNVVKGYALLAWEKVARRQSQSRRKAEAINAHLRGMLATQQAVAHDLIRVIQRAEEFHQEIKDKVVIPIAQPLCIQTNSQSDQYLRRRLATITTQWHVPFTKCDKFQDHPNRPRELLFYDVTPQRGRNELVLDIRASTPTAFPREAVEEVLWQYFQSLQCTEDDFSLKAEAQELVDTVVGCLCVSAHHESIHGVLQHRFMKQRFRNSEGDLVIATTCSGQPKLTSNAHPLANIDAMLFEDSWLRVLRLDDDPAMKMGDPTTVSSGVTLIQHVRRSRLQFSGENTPDLVQMEALERFFTCLAKNELRWSQEVIERSLILGQKNLLRS